ncbi:hypothetical protein ND748_03235 [Frankia sp. AiPs1]|uniref:AMIN-like domain-containing (lipo)protein n=1 Tax=Frankia sp. AiPs1 TaxID=573493 RepID=UPI002044B1DB|nr:hypothetical protein [Frankia sp. AiPs1]MCM3920691.1 hypothetical protein [Frankia sp. AiPs1]
MPSVVESGALRMGSIVGAGAGSTGARSAGVPPKQGGGGCAGPGGRRRSTRAGLLATMLAVVLVACSGSGGGGGGGTASPSTSPVPTASASVTSPATSGGTAATPAPTSRGTATAAASLGPRADARSWSSQPATATRQATRPVRLVSLRSGTNVENGVHFQRLVLEFAGGVPGYRAGFVPQVIRPGSGAPLPLAGQADFELVLTSTAAHDDQGTSTLRTAPDGTGQSGLSYALAGDFEGTVHIGVGLGHVGDFRVVELTGPDRLAVDFRS